MRRKKLLTIFYFIAIPYIFFYWSWGFNYNRANPELIKYTDNELIEVTEYYLNEVNNLQYKITNNKNEPVKVEDKFSELRKKTVNSLSATTKQFQIKNLTNHTIKTFAAGRTDAGVHASGQVVHFDVDCVIPGNSYCDVLNSILPSTIRILESVEVKDSWHACYSAMYRHYR